MTELISSSDTNFYEKLLKRKNQPVVVLRKTRYKGLTPCLTGTLINVMNGGVNKAIIRSIKNLGGPDYGDREVQIDENIFFSF